METADGSRPEETGDLPTAPQPGTPPPSSSLGASFLSYIKTSNFCLTKDTAHEEKVGLTG